MKRKSNNIGNQFVKNNSTLNDETSELDNENDDLEFRRYKQQNY